MKTKLLPLFIILFVLSCQNETLTPTKPLDDMIHADAMLTYSGSFTKGPYGTVTGMAEVFENEDGTLDLKLAEFGTTNGPDLYVYLSKEAMPINFISPGKLKSTSGNQVYPIPGVPDFDEYRYISIHCKAYNHLFGYAFLIEK